MATRLSAVNAANAGLQSGLTSEEARHRLYKFGPQRGVRYEHASLAYGARKILGARSVDA